MCERLEEGVAETSQGMGSRLSAEQAARRSMEDRCVVVFVSMHILVDCRYAYLRPGRAWKTGVWNVCVCVSVSMHVQWRAFRTVSHAMQNHDRVDNIT